ncbi:phage protein [Vibrio phage pTD1]|uniref:Phage protein n=1 Tax=Vibrio phage pTD1 TaxID=1938577 RepID=A0A1Q2U340_9CAUD|nr:phage protein [Vibrio phage pTD1]BAW98372.1 phage protein [Vibrio phage pTD1]
MFSNAYDTYVGKPLAHLDHVPSTLKRLSLSNDLLSLGNGVYSITHDNGQNIPFLNFPLSMIGFNRKPITVMDDRPYTNKNGVVTNSSERAALLVAAYVQQDIIDGNLAVVRGTQSTVARALARAWGSQIIRQSGLEEDKALSVYIILIHYYNCLVNGNVGDMTFTSQNLCQQVMGIDRRRSLEVLEQIDFIDTLPKLHEALVNYPGMYKLKNMQVKDLVALGQRIWYSATGKQIVGAGLEHPPLLVGMCAATISDKNAYGKTPLGMQLDPKYNEKNNRALVMTITNSYPIIL